MRKRNHRIVFYLDDSELERLHSIVKQSGRSREAVIRTAIENTRLVQLPPVDYGKLIFEMRRVGQNVNRLLRIAYANNYFNTPEIKECLERIRTVEDKIHAAFFEAREDGDGKNQ